MHKRALFLLVFILCAGCGGTDVSNDLGVDTASPDLASPECPASTDCSDGLTCTQDLCTMPGEACDWELVSTHCLIDGVCRNPTETNPLNPCQLCDPTKDQFSWTAVADGLACDDDNACTVNERCENASCSVFDSKYCEDGDACTVDGCDSSEGCVYELKLSPCCGESAAICDDGNPCTVDLCDENTLECDFQPSQSLCDDGDPCTKNDQCGDGLCQGEDVVCDDGNECTSDQCYSGIGCNYAPKDNGACDDDYACTTNEQCQAGVCVGDSSECSCVYDFGDALKIVSLQIGEGGHSGAGLDVDGDSSTCSPASDCSGGINNALGILATIANPAFVEQLADGIGMALIEIREDENGKKVAILQAKLSSSNSECNFQETSCDYEVYQGDFNEFTCQPTYSMPSVIQGTSFTAGEAGSILPFTAPVNATDSLVFDIHSVLVDGTISKSGTNIVSFEGVVGGAVRKDDLIDAIELIPEGALLVNKAVIVSLITFMDADIDTDADGQMDALSIGIVIQAIDANISGTF